MGHDRDDAFREELKIWMFCCIIKEMKRDTYSGKGIMMPVLAILAAFCMSSVMAFGLVANRAETWNNSQMNSWANDSDPGVLVLNPGDYLKISFSAQGIPMPAVGGAAGGVDASGGIFSGDYIALLVSNITFSVMTDGHIPASMRMVLRGAKSGREWSYSPINVSGQAGVWVNNSIPVDYSIGRWRLSGPGASEEDFLKDLKDVDLIGIRIERSGTAAQTYSIDNICLEGVNIPGTIRGKIKYKGCQDGKLIVVASTTGSGWSSPYVTELTKPGSFELSNVVVGSNYWVKAYIDANSNGGPDELEPTGEYPSNSVDLLAGSINDVDITLTEAVQTNGLPMWWVLENSTGPDGMNIKTDADDDGDGVSNLKEYIAGTDPHDRSSVFQAKTEHKEEASNRVVLKWKSPHLNKKYQVWRCTNLMAGFTLLEGGIAATPPENSYEDVTANGEGPYFYRIKIEVEH